MRAKVQTAGVNLHVFGIRHHGPGSARSLRRALDAVSPDIVLIEGPPDAQEVVSLAAHANMRPPVAILIYDPARPYRAVNYPLAEFSPEWQALLFAAERGVPSLFIDLPQAYQLGVADLVPENAKEPSDDGVGNAEHALLQEPNIYSDPLSALATAAGHKDGDGERWWERFVEQRRGDSTEDIFVGIAEAMQEVRSAAGDGMSPFDALSEGRREAHMRTSIRTAIADGNRRIAVVCGAWHAPMLIPSALHANLESDKVVLAQLPKRLAVNATWVPWTYDRLKFTSGYGAGVASPGWYDHLWRSSDGSLEMDHEQIAIGWMIKVANHLRSHDLDASPAHAIESVRLAQCLASLRGHAIPGLGEMNEAARTVFCFGSELPMRLINEDLIVGQRLGAVPDETPMVPLQRDLQAHQRRLRLPPEATQRMLDLDLRKEGDLERSRLLRRLNLLMVAWGVPERSSSSGKGTFRELWRLQWRPEMEIALIAAGIWGNTVDVAAAAFVIDTAMRATELPAITSLLDCALLADLSDAIPVLMHFVDDLAANATDVTLLMNALPPLANIARYGDVRKIAVDLVTHVTDGLVVRICVGLPGACHSLNDEAAGAMYGAIVAADSSISILQNVEYDAMWRQTLRKVADTSGAHGLVGGRCIRLLHDDGDMEIDEVARHLGLGLSTATDPAQAAAWIEGFLMGSGLILAHDDALFEIVDGWLTTLHSDIFTAVLPLVRRTFSTFTSPERRAIGERAAKGPTHAAAAPDSHEGIDPDFDIMRAKSVLPVVAMLLGANVIEP